ncbi:MAG: N-acetylmuramoyl-L-alanine amidase [Flavobacteriales bacterium]|nr:N-acetylmuramoyl-L-alanine amidase [Flavobacteriales bacterium]
MHLRSLKNFILPLASVLLLSGLGRKSTLRNVSASGLTETIELHVRAGQEIDLLTELSSFSSVVLEFPDYFDLKDFQVRTTAGDVFPVRIVTKPDIDEPRRSAMFMTDHANTSLQVKTGNYTGPLKIYLIGAPGITLDRSKVLHKSETDCSKPDFIASETWRAGLPDPVPGRSVHKVDHLIVHHSAGSNSITDYTLAVRNIYLYHLEVNGWDDVGYNYLIAPNGQIYQGRDDLGVGPEDNIKGAHFCGKNTGTMGVCLMGNYDEAEVADSAFHALIRLFTWKCVKEGMDPRQSLIHPADIGTDSLGRIAGHRDGCNTRCPGDNAYTLLHALIDSVYNRYIQCEPVVGISRSSWEQFHISPNPVRFPIYLTLPANGHTFRYRIIDLQGKTILNKRMVGHWLDPEMPLQSGSYFLEIEDRDNGMRYFAKFIVAQP